MAVAQAGQSDAQAQDNEEQQSDQGQQGNDGQAAQDGGDGGDGQQGKGQQAARTYSQEELDRILGKVRKNARYLGRKEAEAELRSQGASAQQARETVDRQQEDEAPPQQKDGEAWEDFLERKAEYAGRKGSDARDAERRKKEDERTAAEKRKDTEREFKKRADELKKEIPDLYDVLESAEDVMISNAMGEAIQESPLGPRILHHLVKNPDEAARIAGLSPTAAAREIGKLEAKLEAGIKKAPAPQDGNDGEDGNDQQGDDDKGGDTNAGQSQERRGDGTFKAKKPAPDPIEPGSAHSASSSSAPSDKDDMKTWMEKRNAEEAAKRRRRK